MNSPEWPPVTLVTATYNAANHLPNLLASIHAQGYPNLEWIVVDGGSVDGTLDLLRENADVVTQWISEPDQGIYDAWNKGLKLARGEWIGFLGADDVLMPDAIEAMVRIIDSLSEPPDFTCGRVMMTRVRIERETIGLPWDWSMFRRYMCVAHTGALHRAAYFERYGTFDTSFRISGDYELLLRAGPSLRVGYIDQVLVHSELGGVSNRNALVFKENLRAKLRHHACGIWEGTAFMLGAWFMWALRRKLAR